MNSYPLPLHKDTYEIGFLAGLVILMILIMLGFFLLQFSLINLKSSASGQDKIPLTLIEKIA